MNILTLLADKNYDTLAKLTEDGQNRLLPDEIAATARGYPGTIKVPAEEDLIIDVVEVEGSSPRCFMVDAVVFTVEEGPSDLTARMIVVDSAAEPCQVVFYDLLVK